MDAHLARSGCRRRAVGRISSTLQTTRPPMRTGAGSLPAASWVRMVRSPQHSRRANRRASATRGRLSGSARCPVPADSRRRRSKSATIHRLPVGGRGRGQPAQEVMACDVSAVATTDSGQFAATNGVADGHAGHVECQHDGRHGVDRGRVDVDRCGKRRFAHRGPRVDRADATSLPRGGSAWGKLGVTFGQLRLADAREIDGERVPVFGFEPGADRQPYPLVRLPAATWDIRVRQRVRLTTDELLQGWLAATHHR